MSPEPKAEENPLAWAHTDFARRPQPTYDALRSSPAALRVRVALQVWHERIPDHHLQLGTDLALANGVRAVERFPMVRRSAGGWSKR